jgi:EAL domain-containing protein (putative c-di-GMP-specific phosphodiesterase class I)
MDTLISNADQAMYEAKNQGRNRFQYFGEEMQTHALERVSLLQDLRQAISENQLQVFYQPVIDLNDGQVAKAEALLRWHHPQRGTVNPREFLPLAEETGLILEIGEWFFDQVLKQLTTWRSQLANQFHVSINTSPLQFRESSRGLQYLLDQLCAMGLPGDSFGIEIAENLMMDNRIEVQALLASIQKTGIAIALDDFGSGFAPLKQLQDFQIDYLKVDPSLIQQIGTDLKARQLCEAIILMAHKLDIKVVAKGVESDLQRKLLIDAGCDFAQGYLFSKAVSAEKFPFSI